MSAARNRRILRMSTSGGGRIVRVGAFLMFGALVAVGINLATAGGLERADKVSSVVGAILGVVGIGVSIFVALISSPRRDSDAEQNASSPEIEVLKALREVRAVAEGILPEKEAASPMRIRASLRNSGLWSDEDVNNFDSALRVRNIIAHGDIDQLEAADVQDALEKLRKLKRKLEESLS